MEAAGRRSAARKASSLCEISAAIKASSGHRRPTHQDIHDLMGKISGDTTVIACTLLVNALSQDVLCKHAGKCALGRIPADYESNPENYDEANYRPIQRSSSGAAIDPV